MSNPFIEEAVSRYPMLDACRTAMETGLKTLEETFARGGKMLVCGNGGSAADAEHIVGEMIKGFLLPRTMTATERHALEEDAGEDIGQWLQGGLPAIALGAHTALLTAVANDTNAEMIFAQQVYVLGNRGDVLLGISTSGNSLNVVRAVQVARHRGMHTVALTGRTGGRLARVADTAICVPADRVTEVQEFHLPVYHALCAALEARFFG